jgi:capsule polysaccharide export protein KpsE/RkpR
MQTLDKASMLEQETEADRTHGGGAHRFIGDSPRWSHLLVSHPKFLLRCVMWGFLLSILVAFLLPVYYKSETAILPPQQAQSLSSSMLGQIAPLIALTGKDVGLKNPSDLYVAFLQSQAISDEIIMKFRLQEVYDQKRISDARKTLEDRTVVAAGKDGLIRVSVEDRDQHRAVLLANEYTKQLYVLNQRLAITEASQRRLFFGEEMQKAKADVSNAEVQLKKIQESTGLIQLDAQSKAIISSMATLRAEVAAKEVELRSMELFSTQQNPEYRLLEQQTDALRAQLAKAENSPVAGKGDIMIPTGNVPGVGLEYMRRVRDVQYYEGIFELLAKQYEIAKIDEAKTAPVIQVVDGATISDKKSRPNRPLILALGTFGSLIAGFLWLAMRNNRDLAGSSELSIDVFHALWRELRG